MTRRARSSWLAAAIVTALVLTGCKDAATTTSPTTTSPVTELFSGQFVPGGSASRAFTAASAGTVTVTLSALGPPANAIVGLGIGIPQPSGSGCSMTQAVNTGTSTTPQFSVAVEAGTYCVRIYDLGTLTAQMAFTVTIVRP